MTGVQTCALPICVQAITEQVKALQHSLYPTPKSRFTSSALVLLLFVAPWWMGNHAHPLMIVESNYQEFSLCFFFTAAVVGTIMITLRLWTIWVGVRHLLVALDSLPLRSGFKTIKDFSWKPIWRCGGGNMDDFQRMFNRQKEALDCALNTYPLEVGGLRKDWDETRNLFAKARKPQLGQVPAIAMGTYFKNWWEQRRAERELIQECGMFQ